MADYNPNRPDNPMPSSPAESSVPREPGLSQQPSSGLHEPAGAESAKLGGAAATTSSATAGGGTESAKREAEAMKGETRARTEEAKREAREKAEGMQAYAREKSEQAKNQAIHMIEDAEHRAAGTLHDVCDALHKTSEELRADHPTLSRYTDLTADELDRLASTLENKSVGEIVTETESIARRQPELFIGGAVALGFLLGRFMRSSGRHEYTELESGEMEYDEGEEDYPYTPPMANEPITPGMTTGGAAGAGGFSGPAGI